MNQSILMKRIFIKTCVLLMTMITNKCCDSNGFQDEKHFILLLYFVKLCPKNKGRRIQNQSAFYRNTEQQGILEIIMTAKNKKYKAVKSVSHKINDRRITCIF